jgi:transcriptional regulator with XRE-family HTH domain
MIMTTNQPRQHQNKKVSELRAKADPAIISKARKLMILSAKIEDAMDKRGLNKSSFAQLMGVQPSVITKWLSGTHNFTIETLFDIEHRLGISLLALEDGKQEIIMQYAVMIVQSDNNVIRPSSYEPWKLVDHTFLSRSTPDVQYIKEPLLTSKKKTSMNEC